MEKTVSVIIPAYNHEKYIQDTIKSIFNQTYKNIELIIIDDGSKDTTFSKIKEMEAECQKRFSRFVVETQPNQGTTITLNRLYSIAKGEYVYGIASDDVAAPNAIERLMKETQTGDYVLIACDNKIIDENSEPIGWDKKRNAVKLSDGYKTFWEFLSKKNERLANIGESFGSYESLLHANYIPNGFLMKKSAFDKVGGYTKEAPLEDWYMNLQLAKMGKFKFVNEILFSYRWHSQNSITASDKMKNYMKKTMSYENHLVTNIMPEWKDTFIKATTKQKSIVKFGDFFQIYKVKAISSKRIIIKIFNYQFTLSNKHPD